MPKRQLSQLLLFVFIDVLGYSLFFPLLPYYASQFGAGAYLVGLMIAANAAAQFLVSPLVGYLSDRFGRRPLIMASILGTLISFVLLALIGPMAEYLAHNADLISGDQRLIPQIAGWAIFLLFFCRILDGAAGGNVSLARAYVSDITTEEKRAQGLGMIGAVFGLAFVIGPVIGGTLSNWPPGISWMEQYGLSRFALPAFAAAALSLVNLGGVYFLLPESHPIGLRASRPANKTNNTYLSTLRRFGVSKLNRLLGLRLIFSLAITLFMANFAIFTQYHIGLSDQATSFVLTYAGILLILVQAVGIRWLVSRYPEMKIVYYSSFIVTASLLSLGWTSNILSLMVVILPLALAGGAINTIVSSLISKAANKDQVGAALGLATSLESFSWIIAPIIGGVLIDFYGGVAFSVAGSLCAGVSIFYMRFYLLHDADHKVDPQI